MSMTPEEIDKIYIQEHGMTKGAFSVGLQGSPCPSESPVHLTHFAAGGTGY